MPTAGLNRNFKQGMIQELLTGRIRSVGGVCEKPRLVSTLRKRWSPTDWPGSWSRK